MVNNFPITLTLILLATGCNRYGGPEPFQGIVEFQERKLGFEQRKVAGARL